MCNKGGRTAVFVNKRWGYPGASLLATYCASCCEYTPYHLPQEFFCYIDMYLRTTISSWGSDIWHQTHDCSCGAALAPRGFHHHHWSIYHQFLNISTGAPPLYTIQAWVFRTPPLLLYMTMSAGQVRLHQGKAADPDRISPRVPEILWCTSEWHPLVSL